MYYEYFGFRQPPFKITPDTNLFYPGGERGAVLEALLYAIVNGEGIVKVVGEVGSGKTMLCRMLEQELPGKVEVVYLANPSLAPENTVHAIAFELNLDIPAGASRFEVMNRLQEYLLQQHSQDRQVVVFVEEAQSMPLATLEEIRLLSNLETKQNKLLQIVLFGQPELDEMIATPEIRQLKERITYSFRLNPFQSDDIRDYLNSRARACGYRADTLFERTAIREIERHSKGLLRRINILADKALLAAYAEHSPRVTSKHIRKAAADSEFSTEYGRRRTLQVIIGAATLGLLAAIFVWFAPGGPAGAPEAGRQGSVPSDPAIDGTADKTEIPTDVATEPESGSRDRIIPLLGVTAITHESFGPEISPRAGTVAETQAAAASKPAGKAGIDPEIVEQSRSNDDHGGPKAAPGDTPARPGEAPGETSTKAPETPVDTGQSFTVLEVDVLDGAALSEMEVDALLRQLEGVHPETVVSSESHTPGKTCDRCRSIVYRPLKRVENL